MKSYLQIPQCHLKSAARWLELRQDWVFQQEKDPNHASKIVLEWIKQASFIVLDFWNDFSKTKSLIRTKNL